jgi:hypothetical protein
MTHEQMLAEIWKDAERILIQPLDEALPQCEEDTDNDDHEAHENGCNA